MRAEPLCPRSEDAAAFVAGEPVGDFEAHLATCADCARAVDSARSLVSLLRAAPEVGLSRDLAPQVMKRLSEQSTPRGWRIAAAFAAAAAVVLVLGLSRTWLREPAPPPYPVASENVSVSRALDWLAKAQEPDGSWSATRWGGDARFEVALTALPLIALLESEHRAPDQTAAATKAVRALRERQAENGTFGGAFFGSCYNQGIATFALLHAYQRHPNAELKHAIESACEVIAATQKAGGGWGYLGSPQAHPAITLWNLEALQLAATLGFPIARPDLDRAAQWLRAATSDTTPPGGVDFYNARLLAAVLGRPGDSPAQEKLAAIREMLLATQERDGAANGSWAPGEQWGRVGGRLYSTAVASLALR